MKIKYLAVIFLISSIIPPLWSYVPKFNLSAGSARSTEVFTLMVRLETYFLSIDPSEKEKTEKRVVATFGYTILNANQISELKTLLSNYYSPISLKTYLELILANPNIATAYKKMLSTSYGIIAWNHDIAESLVCNIESEEKTSEHKTVRFSKLESENRDASIGTIDLSVSASESDSNKIVLITFDCDNYFKFELNKSEMVSLKNKKNQFVTGTVSYYYTDLFPENAPDEKTMESKVVCY